MDAEGQLAHQEEGESNNADSSNSNQQWSLPVPGRLRARVKFLLLPRVQFLGSCPSAPSPVWPAYQQRKLWPKLGVGSPRPEPGASWHLQAHWKVEGLDVGSNSAAA
ncbi:hypothetical protein CRENBAI_022899 [Crenichthys baileyi]|uniref:Uncharacterized protein n=1 Tax=Crenichthys baileyi TaxID=28760 RepID=A0AAV9QZB7_9TELE